MRVIRKIVSSIVLFGFPVSMAAGCAPGGAGASLPPAVSSQAPQAGVARLGISPNAKATAQWPEFGYGPGHSGYNPLETTITTKNVSNLQIGWNDSSIVQPGGIVVDKGVVYVDDMGQTNAGLYALDATTGAQKWYANVNLNGPWGSFNHAVSVVAGNVVITPCSNASSSKFLTGLCGVNASNGKIMWKTYCTEYQGSPCGGISDGGTSPALSGNLVYFQSVQGVNEQPDTQALNPKTGKIVWDFPGVYHCPDAGYNSLNPLPVASGLVFAVLGCQGTTGGTEICALWASSGTTAWCYQSPNAYVADMIAYDGKLYVAVGVNSSINIVAFDAKTGGQAWSATLPGSNYTGLAAAGDDVYVENGANGLYALSASKGKIVWSDTSNGNLYAGGVVSVANGIVYVDGGGGNNGNFAINAFNAKNGTLIWLSSSIGNGGAAATPVIANGTVYAGCYTVCALTLSSKR